jgi:hypothetical protein
MRVMVLMTGGIIPMALLMWFIIMWDITILLMVIRTLTTM